MANVDTYEFRDDDAPSVANICRRLDGIPLAIEFAAARVDLLDVHEIAQRLDDRFSLLTKGYRNALPRQQTLRAVIDWSYGLLSADRKIVLRRLSVFAGHFGVDDAIDVVSGDSIPRLTVLESLSDLVDKSMVLADVSGGTVSHRLLETTQVYAREKLSEAGEVDAVRRRHALRFLEVCKASSGLEDDKRFLGQAIFEVCAALDWALVHGNDITLGIDLASAATPILLRFSLLRDHRKYLELALAHIVAADTKPDSEERIRAEMALRTAVGLALYYTEGTEVAPEDHLQKARTIARKIGDIAHELKLLWMLYGNAGNAGNYRQAMFYAQMYEAVSRASTDPRVEFRRHRILARTLSDLGQYGAAQQSLEMALRQSRDAMPQIASHAYDIDDWVAGRASLARILWLRGYPDDATNVAQQCISEALQLGHEQSTCWALAYNLCPLAIWRGDLGQADTFTDLLLEQSRRVFEHYHEWGLLYRQFLNWSALAPTERKEAWCAKAKPKISAQMDMFATFDEKLVGPDTLARAQADEDIWCAPEIFRAWAYRIMVRGEKTGQSDAKTALDRSLDIARRQEAKAWELRTATTLALFYRGTRQLDEARATLEPVLNHFTQGHGTRDVQAASKLLSELRD
jgi:predicted ATPase